jgi:hypothetical protein
MNYRPGEIVPHSGIYEEQTSGGFMVTEVTCVKGERFPPTESNGYHYKLVRAAKHKPSNG